MSASSSSTCSSVSRLPTICARSVLGLELDTGHGQDGATFKGMLEPSSRAGEQHSAVGIVPMILGRDAGKFAAVAGAR